MNHILRHWSATQISTFRLCQRKWWFGKVMGLEEPPSKALIDGKKFAEELEFYMKTDNANELSPTTRPVVALVQAGRFPKPRTEVFTTYVEHPIGEDTRPGALPALTRTILDVDGTPGVGFMDVFDLQPGKPVVWDFKSTKAKRWIKTTDELAGDVQMVLYAKAALSMHLSRYGTEAEAIGVGHVALLKPSEAPEAVVVGPVWLDRDHIERVWETLKTSVRAMKEVALFTTPDRVTPSWSACSAFGGCPHKDRCQALKTMSTPTTQQGQPTMSLLAKLAASTQTATAPSVAALKPAPVVNDDLAARLRARLSQPGQINPPDAASPAQDKGLAAAVAPKVVLPTVSAPQPPTQAVATTNATGARRAPRNGDVRLKALGWDDYAISCMSVDRKHEVLDGNIAPSSPAEVADPDMPPEENARVWDINSNDALLEGSRLGWTEDQMNSLNDEAFTRILTESINAAGWRLTEDQGIERIPAPVVVPAGPTRAEKAEAARKQKEQADLEAQVKAAEDAALVELANLAEVRRVAAEQEAYQQAGERAKVAQEARQAERALAAKQAEAEKQAAFHAGAAIEPLFLLIDARPAKGFGEYVELAEYLVPLAKLVCERKKVEAYNLLAYNEGEKLLAALLSMNPPSGMVLVDSSLPVSKWALEVLLPIAKLVVRGVR